MQWDAFFDEVKQGKARRVYLFTGSEALIKRNALDALRKALLPDGMEQMNETTLEDATAEQIIAAAETLPFLSERRLVVARDWAPLLPGKPKNETAEAEKLSAWLGGAPESCCLIFYLRESMDGRKKLCAQLQKMGAVVQFDPLSDEKLLKWARGWVKPRGKTIDSDAVDRLSFMAGRDLTRLSGELDKLTAYVGERTKICAEDVERVVSPSSECTVFQMIDRLLVGDMLGAHRLLKSMLESGETRVGVLAMLTRQARLMTHIRLKKAEGLPLQTIEKEMELSHYAARIADGQAARFAPDVPGALYRACVDADFAVKSGRIRDDEALNRLMLQFGEAAQSGARR